MKLTTPVSIPKSDVVLDHQNPSLLIGSCFAQNIGEKLIDHKFNTCINPHGIIFNPISIVNSLQRIIDSSPYLENELTEHNKKWLSLNHHSSFSSFKKEECLSQINDALECAHQHIQNTKTIFITVGSSWVYEFEKIGVVANCHKIPNKQFSKRLLSVKEIITAFETIKNELKEYNVVFTVSPVRHAKDGLHENNLSKSTLLLAINNLVEQNDNYSYFPAYELVIDELRDYRYYKNDLVHPTDLAVNYVWEKFSDCYFSESTQTINDKIQKIKIAVNHRPFNFNSDDHQKFIAKQTQEINTISKEYPFLNFEKEVTQISSE